MQREDSSSNAGGGADRKRAEHMLVCAEDAIAIVSKDDAEGVSRDMIRTRAFVNYFTEIGEAAARMTREGRARICAVTWRQIVGMRDIVVHVYWGIDVGELVKTVRDDLPAPVATLKQAMAAWPEE